MTALRFPACLLLAAALASAQENPISLGNATPFVPTTGMAVGSIDVAHNRSGDGVMAGRARLGVSPSGIVSYDVFAQPLRRGEPFGAPVSLGTLQDGVTGTAELLRVR